jgi:hypothetical protein
MDRDLGELGELELARWAAARGISAQKVTKDRHGWDYLLEFKLPRTTGSPALPIDTASPPISCLVQVKSTSTGDLNRPVELINWLRLIKNPLPVFFLILDFGLSDTPSAAYLVPLGKYNIRRALQRIRQLDSESADLADHTLGINCRKEYMLEAPNGASLERAIRRHIGPSLEKYIQQKREWERTVGYEVGRGTFRFEVPEESLNGRSFPEAMVDLCLGLREPLDIGYAEFRDVRFNIPAREPFKEYPSGTLEIIVKPVETVEVTLQFGASVVRTKMEMFLPYGLGNVLEMGLLKIRLKSKLFEFVDCGSRMDISIRPPESNARVRLSDFRDLASVVLLLRETGTSNEGAKITVRSSKGTVLQKTVVLCTGLRPDLIELATVVQDAWAIARHLEIEGGAEPTTEELLQQKERLSTLRKLLAGETLRSIYKAFFDPEFLHVEERACALHPIGVILGDYIGTVMVSLWGAINPTGRSDGRRREYELITAEAKAEGAFATTRNEDHLAILRAARNAFAETNKDMLCLLPPDI